MRGLFVNGYEKEGQGTTDFGYYTDETGLSLLEEDLDELFSQNRAYIVETFKTSRESIHINLRSYNRWVDAETFNRIEKKGPGLGGSIHVTTADPILPADYEDPNQAIEVYAEYTLKHGQDEDISIEGVNWENLLDGESLH